MVVPARVIVEAAAAAKISTSKAKPQVARQIAGSTLCH